MLQSNAMPRRKTKSGRKVSASEGDATSVKRSSVTDVARAIVHCSQPTDGQRRGRFIFWLGAGSSVSAGIPLADAIVDRLLDRLWIQSQPMKTSEPPLQPLAGLSEPARAERQMRVRSWAIGNIPEVKTWARKNKIDDPTVSSDWGGLYSTCLALLQGEEARQEFIVECFKEGRGRLNLAHLLMAQLMVTGFVRTILTTNFDDLLLRALQFCFEVPAILDPDSTGTLMAESRFLQVAYLHGKLSSYRQRHTPESLRERFRDLRISLGRS
ncbi:MAG: hypothetical protein DMG22_19860 [Acidobacteria bacterium]|nr:MAG: hypothetical protein DMG22_19860 [Acidobacteriota bacterium]